MSKGNPENLESRLQLAHRLAKESNNMRLLFMGMSLVGLAGFVTSALIYGERYLPLTNTLEEIKQGVMNPATKAAAIASIGPTAFLVFTAASVIAYGYYSYQALRYENKERKLLEEMEKQSKRPPTLGI